MIISLGGKMVVGFNGACTHFVYESTRVNDTSRELEQAKVTAVSIVSPYWVKNVLSFRKSN